ncbi:hypothetical protein D3C73_1147230 [compost metagenome]
MVHPFTRCQPPVFQKNILQTVDRIPFQTQMGVPPISQLRIFPQIIIPYVQASGEPHTPVDHNDFPVITEVEPAVQQGDHRRQEEMDLHSGISQRVNESPAQLMTAKTITEQTHPHPLA